jgi:hypothetical protein
VCNIVLSCGFTSLQIIWIISKPEPYFNGKASSGEEALK